MAYRVEDNLEMYAQLILPFEEQLFRERPSGPFIKANVWTVDAKIIRVLDSIRWSEYENCVVSVISEAVRRYNKLVREADSQPVYQIAICTGLQPNGTSISLETRDHAFQHLQAMTNMLYEWGRADGAEEWINLAKEYSGMTYNPSQADFKYWGFAGFWRHPELQLLEASDLGGKEAETVAEAYIERSLLRVVDRILNKNLLADLPCADEVWIGVSSPRDWYDNVRPIRRQDGKWRLQET